MLVIGETEGDRSLEDRLIEEMIDRQVDGFLYTTRTTSEVDPPAALRQQSVVLLNCSDRAGDLRAVVPDELAAGRLAAQTLLDAGHRGPVHVVGEDPTPRAVAGRQRTKGIRAALRKAGVRLDGILPCLWDVRAAHDEVAVWLAAGARPGSLICLNDRVAMGTYQALLEHGLRVPEDVSVVSFDGSELATWLRPALTSVVLPFSDMGSLAVGLLMGTRRTEREVHVPMPLLPGASVRTIQPVTAGGAAVRATGTTVEV